MGGQDEHLREKEREAKGLGTKESLTKKEFNIATLLLGISIGLALHSLVIVLCSVWFALLFGIPLLASLLVGFLIAAAIVDFIPRSARLHPVTVVILLILIPVAAYSPFKGTEILLQLQADRFTIPEGAVIQRRSTKVLYMDGDPGFRMSCASNLTPDEILAFYESKLTSEGWTLSRDYRLKTNTNQNIRQVIEFRDGQRRLVVGAGDSGGFNIYYRPWRIN